MLFWHLGATVWIFRYVFRDPAVDLRPLALGGLAANLVDVPLTTLIAPDSFSGHRAYAHTLVLALVALVVAVAGTRRSTEGRKRAVALSVGMLIHLLLDAMWTMPETLFWPAFGLSLSPGLDQTLGGLVISRLTDPVVIALEVVGLAYVLFLAHVAGLGDPHRRRRFVATGQLDILPPPELS